MADKTNIEWCDSTFNPWEGCTKVGPGCDNCYAEARNARFAGGSAINWGPGAPRRRTSAANWHKPMTWDKAHAEFFAQHGRRQRVFCASLADVFDNEVDPQWRADLFDLILRTPKLDWMLLTKRIGNVRSMLPMLVNSFADVFPNVWIGATVVNQTEADRDIPKLLAVLAAKRFLSIEPMLGPMSLAGFDGKTYRPWLDHHAWKTEIDWVICGGESGPNARPMHPEWAQSLRDQCAAAGVPFMFKQWGEWAPEARMPEVMRLEEGDSHRWSDPVWSYRVGKKAAGRLLYGVEHNGFPD